MTSVITEKTKFSFITAIIAMGITHLYAFTNLLVNHDSLNYLLRGESKEYYYGCGRWMLYWITRLSGTVTLNVVIGVLCILASGVTCVLVTELFSVRSKWSIAAISFLFATFPVAANSICYIYNADGIFIGLAGGTFCVVLILNEKQTIKSRILEVLLLIAVCGIYQTCWCFSVALVYCVLVYRYFQNELSVQKLIENMLKVIAVYLSSIVGYLFCNKVILYITQIEAAGYAGLNDILGFTGVQNIIDVIYLAYKQTGEFYFIDGNFVKNQLLVVVNIFFLCFVFFCLIKNKIKNKNALFQIGVGGVLLFFFPAVLNCVSIASKGYLHSVMMWPFVLPYFFVVGLLDEYYKDKVLEWKSRNKWFIVGIVCVFFFTYVNFLVSNKIYTRQDLNYEATYAYLERMLLRIESSEEYKKGIAVGFINEMPLEKQHIDILAESYPTELSIFDDCNGMIGCNVHTPVKNLRDIYDFYKIFMGTELVAPEEEKLQVVKETEKFKEMPVYPEQGSIAKIDEILVVKIANNSEGE